MPRGVRGDQMGSVLLRDQLEPKQRGEREMFARSMSFRTSECSNCLWMRPTSLFVGNIEPTSSKSPRSVCQMEKWGTPN